MNKTFRRMLGSVLIYRKLFFSGLVLVFIGAFIDLVPPRLQSWGIDNLIVENKTELLIPFIIVYLAVAIASGLLVFSWIKVMGALELRFSRDLRNKIFNKVQELHLQYFNENNDGWIISRMTSDVSKLSEVMSWQITDCIYFIIIVIFSIISIATYSIKAGVVVVLIYPLLIVVLYIIKSFVLKQFRKVRKQNSIITSKFNEFISGVLTIKTMAIEEENFQEFNEESIKLKRYSQRQIIFSGLFPPTIIVLGYLMFSVVLGYSVDSFIVGDLSLGEIAAIMSYTYILLEVTTEITNVLSQLQNAQANAERIYGLLDTEIEIRDYDSSFDDNEDIDVYGDIIFNNVTFKYKNGETIFDNFNATLEKGKSCAIVGSTGSGKTTLVNLISRFYEPQSGSVLVNNYDVKELANNKLHRSIGHVLQHPFLFNGTVYENIKYNSNASRDDVINICRELSIDKVFDKLADGIDTNVGEGGSKLSVGEKQLISFARALITNPKIVILDEATSSIDYESEMLIQNVIQKIMENRTVIIIAHRLSTIEECDRILFLRNGKIIEDGNHSELLKLKGSYYEMVESVKNVK